MLTRKDISRIPGTSPRNPAPGGRGPGLRGLRPPQATPGPGETPADAPAAGGKMPPLRRGMTSRLRGMG